VLVTTPRYPPLIGGVETHAHEVAVRLARQGVKITVLTTDLTGEMEAECCLDGVHVRRVRAYPADRDYYFAPGIYSAMKESTWDIVHCQGYQTLVAPIAMMSALRLDIPLVVTFHSGGTSSRLRHALRGLQRAALRPLLVRAAALVAVSRFEADFFSRHLGIERTRFDVVANGSNLPARPSEPRVEPIGTLILSVGRLERYKGHHRVIEALPHVCDRIPDVRLRIAGAGPYEASLHRLAMRHGVADRVSIGPVSASDRAGMASLLSQASLVTLLSEYEAHSIAVLEALALERPVLVADTSGLREFAVAGQARSVPLSSTPAEIAAAIIQQIADPISTSRVPLPTWEECAAGVLRVYQSVAASPDKSGLVAAR